MEPMVTYSEERVRFSRRLTELLDKHGYPTKARPRILSEEYGVSDKGARKWLVGEAIPNRDIIMEMAKKYNVSPEALEYGSGVSQNDDEADILASSGKVPIIAKLAAGDATEVFDPYEPGVADEWLACPTPHSKSTFGTYVDGNSMTAESGPSFPHGSVIFADPDMASSATVGDMVVARILGTGQKTFKMLDSEDGVFLLMPLNNSPAYQPIREEFEILAVVIGNYIPIRRGA